MLSMSLMCVRQSVWVDCMHSFRTTLSSSTNIVYLVVQRQEVDKIGSCRKHRTQFQRSKKGTSQSCTAKSIVHTMKLGILFVCVCAVCVFI